MSQSTSHSDENSRVEKGPSGELKKTVSNKTPTTDGSTCRKDDDKIKFRGPDGGPKTYSKEELKKLQVHIEIKKPKAENPSPNVPFDPNLIVPVRRPAMKTSGGGRRTLAPFSEGKVPLFSRIPTVNDEDCDGNDKKEKSPKKKEKPEQGRPHSSRHSTKSRSRSPGTSSRRSDRRHKDYISERDEFIRRRKEAYLREREKYRRMHQRQHSRHRSHSRPRSSSSAGSSSDERSRSSSGDSSHSKSRSSHKSRRSRSRRKSRSRSRSRSYRRDRSHERDDPRHHGPGPSNMPGMIPYPAPPWVNRPPYRHPFMPGPPIPFYPAPMIYAAHPPFRPYPPAFRGAPRLPGRRP